MCDAFLEKEAAAGRPWQYGNLAGMGVAAAIPQGYPDTHFGFVGVREGNACPTCGRRIVSIEDHPRSQGWTTYLELSAPRVDAKKSRA